jgi:hypothetical protein
MQGLFFESDTGVRSVIRFLVMLIGFWTAWRSGKAAAENWSDYPIVIAYTVLLAAAMQFLHHALFDGPVISVFYYVIDFILLLIFSTAGYRFAGPTRWSTTTTGSTKKRPPSPGRPNIDSRLKLGTDYLFEWNKFPGAVKWVMRRVVEHNPLKNWE